MSMSWEERWYGSQPAGSGSALALPLAVAAGAYGVGVALRGLAFKAGLLGQTRVEGIRVISVGNLNVGGAGKTPVVLYLAQRLAKAGRGVAVVSRGYGRASSQDWVLKPGSPLPSASEVGDEPLLIARRSPETAVLVGGRRAALVARARDELSVDTVLLDDGFQHRRVCRDVDIVVVDEAAGFGNGRLLPAGPLREGLGALSRASLIWLRVSEDGHRAALPDFQAPVVRARHRPKALRDPSGVLHDEGALAGREVLALSGIARPSSFGQTLTQLGARVRDHVAFNDHEVFPPTALQALAARAEREGAPLVTTEKDACRLPPGYPAWVVRLEVEVLEGEGHLARALGG